MFAMPEKGPHSQRKRMLSNIYAKSVLQTSVPLAEVSNLLLNQRLVPRLQQVAKSGQPLEMYDLVSAATMDFVTCYIFGLTKGSNFLQDPKRCGRFLRDYKARQKYTFWPQEVAGFTKAMSKVGLGSLLVPSWVNKANSDIEAWILSMCDGAEETLQQENTEQNADYPTVYAQLRNTMMKETEKMDLEMNVQELVDRQRIEVASEMLDHALAGFDTSGITLTYLSWELSRSSEWQQRLRTELHEVENFEPKEIDALPVLNAILMETLRLHAAIPGGQPRMTPPNATLGDFTGLPAGVRVNAQAYSLHRNEEVFPEAEEWRPQRWLEATEEQQKQMGRWFWAFGSGGRMCVGSNFAIQGMSGSVFLGRTAGLIASPEMKAIIASIWSRFQTTVVDDQGMVHNGSYIAEPIGSKEGHYLLLEVKELSA